MLKVARAPWVIGFVCHLLLVSSIAYAAYVGGLPRWLGAFPNIDLVGHAVLIGLLAFFLDGALGFRPLLGKSTDLGQPLSVFLGLRLAPFIVLLLAGAEELAQTLSPNREASGLDFVADVVGVFVLSSLAYAIETRRRRTRR